MITIGIYNQSIGVSKNIIRALSKIDEEKNKYFYYFKSIPIDLDHCRYEIFNINNEKIQESEITGFDCFLIHGSNYPNIIKSETITSLIENSKIIVLYGQRMYEDISIVNNREKKYFYLNTNLYDQNNIAIIDINFLIELVALPFRNEKSSLFNEFVVIKFA